MAIDPDRPFARSPEARTAERFKALEERVRKLETSTVVVATGDGPPPPTLIGPPFYRDRTTMRVYVWFPSGWRWVATSP